MHSKKLLFLFTLALTSLVACKSENTTDSSESDAYNEKIELTHLDSIRSELQKAMPDVPKELYRKAIAMHLQYAESHSKDDFAPVALDYAQGYYEQLQDYRSSLMIINKILNEYPNYKGKKMLMFIKATHHDFLRDTMEARIAYQDYLKAFPNLPKKEKEEIEELIRMVPLSIEERIKMNSGR
jgi:tetratricopeptide (TPR) repeat protein